MVNAHPLRIPQEIAQRTEATQLSHTMCRRYLIHPSSLGRPFELRGEEKTAESSNTNGLRLAQITLEP